MTDDKQKARARARILRRMSREPITGKGTSRSIKGLKEGKRNQPPKPKRVSKRPANYGQPAIITLPSLGQKARERGRTYPPNLSAHVVDAVRRRDIERMASQSADLATRMAIEEAKSKDAAKSEDATAGTEGVGPTELRD